MAIFYKDVNLESRENMISFLRDHFRYYTANSWNGSTSYANNVKVYNLGLCTEDVDKALEMLECEEAMQSIHELVADFDVGHDFRWQAVWNGRSGGYLVLVKGGRKSSGYKSYCRVCGQQNYTSVLETGCVCGRCRQATRIDYKIPPFHSFVRLGESVDRDEDFENWSDEDLQERVELVQDFDMLCEEVAAEAHRLVHEYELEDETYYIPQTKRVLKARA